MYLVSRSNMVYYFQILAPGILSTLKSYRKFRD
jgi:hypothetical protein